MCKGCLGWEIQILTSEAANLNFGLKMCEYTGFRSFQDSSNLPIINFYIKTPVLIILNIKNEAYQELEAAGGKISRLNSKISCSISFMKIIGVVNPNIGFKLYFEL